jgi:hypothetical protein
MATSYNCTIKIPIISTWTNSGYYLWRQITSGSSSGYSSLTALLDDIVVTLDTTYSSTTTYTQQLIGTYTYITFKIRSMGIDPAVSADDLVALSLLDDDGGIFSGTFEAVEVCNDCKDVNIANCDELFDLSGLNAESPYKLVFTDNQSNVQYTYFDSTNEEGIITIDTTNFPDGVFNPYSTYTVSIYDNAGNPMVLSMDAVEYDCYRLTFTPNKVVFD